MTNTKLIIEAIKTDVCYFVRAKRDNYTNWNGSAGTSGLDQFLFDGKAAENTHNPAWKKIPKLPNKITTTQRRPNINFRYELIDKTMKSKKIPLSIPRDEAGQEGDEGFEWHAQYANLQSLYELKSDEQSPMTVEVECEIVTILIIDEIKDYAGFKYPVQRTRWAHEGFVDITEKSVQHSEIDTIIFPDIILPARKSSLTSEQSYKIIRKHVQDNIDPKRAHITSDYDFCFTVKKKIPLCTPTPYQKNIARFGARKPKYVTDYRNNREIEVFEMTYSPYNYKGYTPIGGFKGANVEELKANIDEYLTALMEYINSSIADCPRCLGKGVVVDTASKPSLS